MFGIKTKKDKRIEELEQQLQKFKQNIKVYEYSTEIVEGEPIGWVKEKIAIEFRFMIIDDILFDVTPIIGSKDKLLHGQLKVLKK